jgi:hypothetical protein
LNQQRHAAAREPCASHLPLLRLLRLQLQLLSTNQTHTGATAREVGTSFRFRIF